ncbi:hypothetical protein MRS44_011810 [Fusarium solani]|uniref:uncharacterized protein n=1 Tax=Fusarium solani TaxID=169388 RepID=UPI0023137803|nr:hypothetical protein MRS44_011810 [Fusarium solani]KAJ4202373.1 hypothetical protein NW759_015424 [Fusarium solani]
MATEKQVIVTEELPGSGSPSDQDSLPESYQYGANRDISSNKSFFSWFDPNDSPAERRLVQKLDFFILTYAFVGFWVLYIDRGVLANAYVSGMREDLELFGNQYIQLNAVYSAGYCISMIPATLLITKYKAQLVIPACMFMWGIWSICCFQAKSFRELIAYRFLMALSQGPYFCSIHYILGSWYRTDEIIRRAGIFYVSSGVGTMTTGLLAARVYTNLNGHLGHAGWRWMYLVASFLTFPVAIWGLTSLPGTPRDGKRWFMTEHEFGLAKERMALQGRLDPKGLTLSKESLKRFLGRWHFWVLVPWNVQWTLGFLGMSSGALWLRAQTQYTTAQVNNFTAISPSLGIVWIMSFAWVVDKFGRKAIIPTIAFACGIHFISKFAWLLFDRTSFGFKWFAIVVNYIEVSLSPINYSLANIVCAADAEERAFVISSMLAISTAFGSWVSILSFPTVEAPRFFRGYVMEAVLQITYLTWTIMVVWFSSREERQKKKQQEVKGNP